MHKLFDYIKALPDIFYNSRRECFNWSQNIYEEFKNDFEQIRTDYENVKKNNINNNGYYSKYKNLSNILSLPDYLSFSEEEKTIISNNILFLTGETGIGKSQLLAVIAKKYISNSKPVLLFLGHKFSFYHDLKDTILKQSSLDYISFEDLLRALNELGIINNQPSLLLIDAINETDNIKLWKHNLTYLTSKIRQFDNIRLIISYRNDYEKLLLDDNIYNDLQNARICHIEHYGLINNTSDPISNFLEEYNIPFNPEYYLQSNITNPLYLTWFCQYANNNKISFFELMDIIITEADNEAKDYCNIEIEDDGLIRILVSQICEVLTENEKSAIEENTLLNLSIWQTYGVNGRKISYINALNRFGLLSHYILDEKKYYFFSFNLLRDYCLAKYIINKYQERYLLKEYITNNLLQIEGNDIKKITNIPICSMVCALFSDKYNDFDLSFFKNLGSKSKHYFADSYVDTYKWRKYIDLKQFVAFVKTFKPNNKLVLEMLIENAIKTNNPLNSLFLHKILASKKMPERDFFWTIFINSLTEQNQIYNFIIGIIKGCITKLKPDNAFLILILFSWFLTSSNRLLRDNTSKAMIEILRYNFNLCQKLLELFNDVDDPYVLQRLYGIVLGASLKRFDKNINVFKELAEYVYNTIFKQTTVYPDILLRDYARLIVERFVYEYPDDTTSIDLNIIKPPYNSLSIPRKKDFAPIDKLNKICSGTYKILLSMAFDTTPKYSYGDFGRYKFQHAIEEFKSIDTNLIHDYALDYIFNTLGYDESLFGKYDNSFRLYVIPNRNEHWKERIGKKYQWIAFYNILSRISDYYKLKNDYCCKDEFYSNYQGPWLPYVRDFDPTKNIIPIQNDSFLSDIRPSRDIFKEFVDKNDTIEMINEWLNNSLDIIKNLGLILCSKEKKWVTLYIREFIRNYDDLTSRVSFQNKGDQHIVIVANAFIVPIKNKNKFISILETDNLLNPETKYELFCREFNWSPACKDKNITDSEYDKLNEIDAKPTTQIYRWETEYDNSQTGTIEFYMPSNDLISLFELEQREKDGYYCDKQGNIIAYDLFLEDNSHPHLVIRKDVLDEYLTKNKLVLMWQIWISKVYYTGDSNSRCAICDTKGYCKYESNKKLKFIGIDKQLHKLNEKNE